MKLNIKIDWKSKIIDLLIVIIGITIAFKLNTWNESIKMESEAKEYLENFRDENTSNYSTLEKVIEYTKSTKADIDTLKQILLSKSYSDGRIKNLSSSMMAISNLHPTTTTMENISASGEFQLIKDVDLRKTLITTYNSFEATSLREQMVEEYVNKYVTPFFINNVRFSDFSDLKPNMVEDPIFENIILGYEILLSQQINGYETTLDHLKLLNEKLSTSISTN